MYLRFNFVKSVVFAIKVPECANPTVESTVIEDVFNIVGSITFVVPVVSKFPVKDVESKEISYRSLFAIGLYSTL